MRVGLIIYGSLDTVTGGYLYDRMLVENLRQRGCIVEVISLPQRSYYRCLTDNISPLLLRQVQRVSLDILLQDELNHPSLLFINHLIRHVTRAPIVSLVHHLRCSEPHLPGMNALYRWAERTYLQTVDACIVNSITTQKHVESVSGVSLPSLVAQPGGDHCQPLLSQMQIAPRRYYDDRIEILFVGNLIPRKGLHTLIDSLALLSGHDCFLTVAGNDQVDRAYADRIRHAIAQKGLSHRVRILGAVCGTSLAVCMQRSHILAVPSFYEGFGIIYLEALAFGLPVIATTAGAAQEIIRHGREGLLIEPGDSRTLAEYLAELINDRTKLCTMSLRALDRFRSYPSWAESMGRAVTFLQEIADKNNRMNVAGPRLWGSDRDQ
nr:glycosyltransferase family 4 protein [Deltaproteobacteria bacterium]